MYESLGIRKESNDVGYKSVVVINLVSGILQDSMWIAFDHSAVTELSSYSSGRDSYPGPSIHRAHKLTTKLAPQRDRKPLQNVTQ